MGKLLQIRVSAVTSKKKDVRKTWHNLAELAWPRQPFPGEKHGVTELGEALCRLGKKATEEFKISITKAAQLKTSLEVAADWYSSEANRLSDQLERYID